MKKSQSIRRCEIVSNLKKDKEILFDIDNMQKVLAERQCIQDFSYIIHDKDIYSEADEKKNPLHKSGTLKAAHVHLLMRFNQPQKLNYVAEWFNVPENFVNKIYGSWEDAVLYQIHANAPEKYQYSPDEVTCNFDFKRVLEKKHSQKALEEIIDKILEGKISEYNKTLEIDQNTLVAHAKIIEEAFKVRTEYLQATQKERHTTNIFITGQSGAGKTTLAKMIAESKGYAYFVSSGSNDILDGYKQEECLIIDEIRPSAMGLADLLKMLDPHLTSTVKSRYKNKYLNCEMIILTSILDIDSFYNNVFSEQKEPILQLKRRCRYYIHMTHEIIEVTEFSFQRKEYITTAIYKNTIPQKIRENKETEETSFNLAKLLPFLELAKPEDLFSPLGQEDSPFDKPSAKRQRGLI